MNGVKLADPGSNIHACRGDISKVAVHLNVSAVNGVKQADTGGTIHECAGIISQVAIHLIITCAREAYPRWQFTLSVQGLSPSEWRKAS